MSGPPILLLKASGYSGSGAWLDESGNGFNATLSNGTIGKNTTSNGIILDGSTSWVIPNMTIGPTWTAEAWYKDNGTTQSQPSIITQQYAVSDLNLVLGYFQSNSIQGAFFNVSDSWHTGGLVPVEPTWTHYTITWDGSNLLFYKNSVLVNTTPLSSTANDGAQQYIIGADWLNASFLLGEIGEIRIYNYAVDQTKVTADYNDSIATFSSLNDPIEGANGTTPGEGGLGRSTINGIIVPKVPGSDGQEGRGGNAASYPGTIVTGGGGGGGYYGGGGGSFSAGGGGNSLTATIPNFTLSTATAGANQLSGLSAISTIGGGGAVGQAGQGGMVTLTWTENIVTSFISTISGPVSGGTVDNALTVNNGILELNGEPIQGSSGTVFYSGSGAPGSQEGLEGSVGDTYLDYSTGDIYKFQGGSGGSGSAVTYATGASISTIAGNGTAGLVLGPSSQSQLSEPYSTSVDAAGNVYFYDVQQPGIYKINPAGVMSEVTMNSYTGTSSIYAIDIDAQGNIYLCDYSAHCIWKVSTSGNVTCYAGNGTYGYSGDSDQAISAQLYYPYGIKLDTSGNLYITDSSNYRIRRVDKATGVITTVAGNGTPAFSGDDGLATSASINYCEGSVGFDSNGNMYFGDRDNHRVRKVNKTSGIITTVVGNGTEGVYVDGLSALNVTIDYPYTVIFDSADNMIINHANRHIILRLDAVTGIVNRIAGTMEDDDYNGDGTPATDYAFYSYINISIGADASIYIPDYGNQRIRKVSWASGGGGAGSLPAPLNQLIMNGSATDVGSARATVTTTGSVSYTTYDGKDCVYMNSDGSSPQLSIPFVFDNTSSFTISFTFNFSLILETAWASIFHITGAGDPGSFAALYYGIFRVHLPEYMDFTQNGGNFNQWNTITLTYTNSLYKSYFNGAYVTSVDRSADFSHSQLIIGQNGTNPYFSQVAAAQFYIRQVCVFDEALNASQVSDLYTATLGNDVLTGGGSGPAGWQLQATIGGGSGSGATGATGPQGPTGPQGATGPQGPAGSGSGGPAFYSGSGAPAITGNSGDSYLDYTSNNLYKYEAGSTGVTYATGATISTIAGNGIEGNVLGPSSESQVAQPYATCLDSAGNVYFYDTAYPGIYKINPVGVMSQVTVNSNPNAASIESIDIDAQGNIYLCDTGFSSIWKVSTSGDVSVYAGTPQSSGFSGDDGQATSAQLYYPVGIKLDASGNLYISDNANYRIRRVDKVTGVITTVAGNGQPEFSGDGSLATAAGIYDLQGSVGFDSQGNMYFGDGFNKRVRKVNKTSGIISTVVGTGAWNGAYVDGLSALDTEIPYVYNIVFDSADNMILNCPDINSILRVDAVTGIVNRIAGLIENYVYNGDGTPATDYMFNSYRNISIDPGASIYIPDAPNNRIRKVSWAANAGSGPAGWQLQATIGGGSGSGATGPQGPTGPQGATGPQGPAGSGSGGNQIINGPTGPEGLTGEPGDYFINTTSGVMSQYSGSSFDPTSINGIQVWLDGKDPLGTSILPANGDLITSWVDKSSNNRSFSGNASYNSATLGLTLNGPNDFFTFSQMPVGFNGTVAMVVTINETQPSWDMLLHLGPWTQGVSFRLNGYSQDGVVIGTDGSEQIALASTVGQRAIFYFTFTGSEMVTIFIEKIAGTSIISGTSTTNPVTLVPGNQIMNIGTYDSGTSTLKADIHEVLYYDNLLTNTDKEKIEGYLASKWGLVPCLPEGHPYKLVDINSPSWVPVLTLGGSGSGSGATGPTGATGPKGTIWSPVTFQSFCVGSAVPAGELAYSPDGLSWTNSPVQPFTSPVAQIAWNGSMWLAGSSGDPTHILATSSDGISWTGLTSTDGLPSSPETCSGIAWGNSMWMVVISGNIYTSTNGTTWTQNTTFTGSANTVAYGNGQFVVGEVSNLRITRNGIVWTSPTNIASLTMDIDGNYGAASNIGPVNYNGKIWITGIGGGFPVKRYTTAYSFDAITWYPGDITLVGTVRYATPYAFCSNGSVWLAAMYSNIGLSYSADGITWRPTTNGSTYIGDTCTSVTYNGKYFIATGYTSVNNTVTNPIVIYSEDGLFWQPLTSANTLFTDRALTFCSKSVLAIDIAGPQGATGATGPQGATGLGFTWMGPYNNTLVYSNNDVVEYNGSCYICTGSNTTVYNLTIDDIKWYAGVSGSEGPNILPATTLCLRTQANGDIFPSPGATFVNGTQTTTVAGGNILITGTGVPSGTYVTNPPGSAVSRNSNGNLPEPVFYIDISNGIDIPPSTYTLNFGPSFELMASGSGGSGGSGPLTDFAPP